MKALTLAGCRPLSETIADRLLLGRSVTLFYATYHRLSPSDIDVAKMVRSSATGFGRRR